MRVGGIDSCRGGWVVVLVDNPGCDGAVLDVAVRTDFVQARRCCDRFGAEWVGVDIPIALAADGEKPAEREARRRLDGRRSSLFPSPAHAVLRAADWADALAVNRSATGKGLSKQVYNLLPKIRDVRSAIGPDDQPRFSEVHPESSFVAMAGRVPAPKKTAFGQLQRLALVETHLGSLLAWTNGPASPGGVAGWAGSESPSGGFGDSEPHDLAGAALDDVLDACAAAWTACRLQSGVADVLGVDDGVDPDGYRLTISI